MSIKYLITLSGNMYRDYRLQNKSLSTRTANQRESFSVGDSNILNNEKLINETYSTYTIKQYTTFKIESDRGTHKTILIRRQENYEINIDVFGESDTVSIFYILQPSHSVSLSES